MLAISSSETYSKSRLTVMGRRLLSKNSSVKQIHAFASCFPFFTVVGIFAVSSSSSCFRIPFLLRKPTMIFGTPSKNDWIQNLRSLCS